MKTTFRLKEMIIMKSYIREPINAFTHLGGALLFLIATVILLVLGASTPAFTLNFIVSVIIFGLSLVLLYTTSGIYHLVIAKETVLLKLKKLDHSMIFILIAGSYTPFCLLSLSGAWKWSILSVVWTVAILGITSKILWINMPRWLSTLLYIGMGWIALFALKPLYDSLTLASFLLLVLGGVMYTIGGVIYAIKKPNISKSFGFHELFHIFCILGSACHYLSVLNIIL